MENKPMRLLLIEDDAHECEKFKEIASNNPSIDIVGITNSSDEGIKYVKKYVPDGIILDLELNEGTGSGFDFIQTIKNLNLEITPKIVVTTNVCSDSVYEYLHQNKIDFIFYKKQENYSPNKVIATLLLLKGFNNNKNNVENVDNEEEIKENISEKIDKELDLIGVGVHLKGRKYLHDAIFYLITNKNKAEGKMSTIQYLMGIYKKPSSTISRGMQNAILYAWRVSAIEDLTTYYTAKVNYETGVPTPTEFIYYYADKIKKTL